MNTLRFEQNAERFKVGLMSEVELIATAEPGTRIEVKPAVILLWHYGAATYIERVTRR